MRKNERPRTAAANTTIRALFKVPISFILSPRKRTNRKGKRGNKKRGGDGGPRCTIVRPFRKREPVKPMAPRLQRKPVPENAIPARTILDLIPGWKGTVVFRFPS